MKVLELATYEVANPSANVHDSISRSRKHRKPQEPKVEIDMMANINYYNEHGKLPSAVDMQKVMGKGDAYTRRRVR